MAPPFDLQRALGHTSRTHAHVCIAGTRHAQGIRLCASASGTDFELIFFCLNTILIFFSFCQSFMISDCHSVYVLLSCSDTKAYVCVRAFRWAGKSSSDLVTICSQQVLHAKASSTASPLQQQLNGQTLLKSGSTPVLHDKVRCVCVSMCARHGSTTGTHHSLLSGLSLFLSFSLSLSLSLFLFFLPFFSFFFLSLSFLCWFYPAFSVLTFDHVFCLYLSNREHPGVLFGHPREPSRVLGCHGFVTTGGTHTQGTHHQTHGAIRVIRVGCQC